MKIFIIKGINNESKLDYIKRLLAKIDKKYEDNAFVRFFSIVDSNVESTTKINETIDDYKINDFDFIIINDCSNRFDCASYLIEKGIKEEDIKSLELSFDIKNIEI